jgi:threonine/homoserine/homoserine lactone efflux protein
MDWAVVLKGILLGLSIAAPVGPIGVLCIRRTLAEGRLTGFVSGLGAATADAFYGSIAAFGITVVSTMLVSQQMWLRLIGGAFLCYLGVRAFLARASDNTAPAQGTGLLTAYGSTLLLTITNPMTIISFAAIFAGLGVSAGAGYAASVSLVSGVFLGSAMWWFILSGGVSLFRTRLNVASLRWVNRISGFVLTAFGVLALVSAGV